MRESATRQRVECIYEAAAKLLNSGAVKGILGSSYAGVFVDEYQDCSGLQHQVIKAIANYLPVGVFGDPLQAIFDLKGQKPVDWAEDVFPIFSKALDLTTPWRWKNAGNSELADWLASLRLTLEQGGNIDLKGRPGCVKWESLPSDQKVWQGKIVGTCKAVMGKASGARLVVIGDPSNINMRASLAKKLAAAGFTNIEPLGCKHLYEFAKKIQAAKGFTRLEIVLEFICACMIGAERANFLKAVKAHQCGKKRGASQFGDLIKAGIAVADGTSEEDLLNLMQGFHAMKSSRVFRKERFFSMRSALRIKSERQHEALTDVVSEVQNRIRHTGRSIGKRCIGSTLLVKGLEFDHAVIIQSDNMSRKDWYVALTRATTSVTILSSSESISPSI